MSTPIQEKEKSPPIHVTKAIESKLAKVDFNDLSFGKHFTDHMLLIDYQGGHWQNRRIIPYRELAINPATSVLHYGQSVFEGLKAFNQADGSVSIFRPYENARRINRSAERLCMPTISEDLFVSSIAALVEVDREWIPKQEDNSLYIRPFIFATDVTLGVQPSEKYLFTILLCPVGKYFAGNLKVKVETHYARAAPGGIGFAKAGGNYAASLLPTKIAFDEGFNQVIWTDANEHAYIEELGAANLMFVIDGTLVTPCDQDTILKGITRDSIIQLAKSWNMPVEERRIAIQDLLGAIADGKLSEAFSVGTAAVVTPIVEIGYKDQLYKLPSPESFSFANKALQTLKDIQYGRAPDAYGWNYTLW